MKRQDERFHGEDKGMSKPAMARRLRIGRYSNVGQVYWLASVVKDREAVFQDFQLGRRAVNALRYDDEQGWTASLAWVAMPDHLHWRVELRQHSLSLLMQQMKSRSAKAVFQDQPTKRTVWQAGYLRCGCNGCEGTIRYQKRVLPEHAVATAGRAHQEK